jgi:hypothetical protein
MQITNLDELLMNRVAVEKLTYQKLAQKTLR